MAFLRFVFLALLVVCTTGQTEKDPCGSSPCQEGTTCQSDGQEYKCHGDPCGSSPCQEGTTCEWTDGQKYKCHGDPCNAYPCKNGESCVSDGSQYKCVCSGVDCEEKDPCDSSPCGDGESCLSHGHKYECVCSGVNCEKKDPCDSSPCEDGESCLSDGSQYKCVCSAINCEEKDPCDTIKCANGGKCSSKGGEAQCVCTKEYTGDYCQVPRVLLGDIGKCEDGVRVKLFKRGAFGIESCVNAKPFYQYYCQGPCKSKSKKRKLQCVPVAGDDQEIPMQSSNGKTCEPYMNAVIRRCDCSSGNTITPVERGCRLVKRTYKSGTYAVNFGRKKCQNKDTYFKSNCRGSCPDQQRCRGKYERVPIEFECKEGKRKSTFTRVELSATKCDCDCPPVKG